MKKIILLTSLLLQIACGQSSQQGSGKQTEDLREYELKGNVKSLEYATYEAIDKSGEIIADKEPTYLGVTKILFDKNGNKTEWNNNRKIPTGIMSDKSIYIYDGDKLIKEEYYDSDNKKVLYTYEYNKEGYKSKKIKIMDNGETIDKVIYEYNSKGKLIKETEDMSDLSPDLMVSTYKYDEKGNLIEYSSFSDYSEAFIKYKYNDKNQLIEVKKPLIEEGEYTEYLIYDNNDNLLEKRYTNTGYYEDWKEARERYELDKQGNWIKKIKYEDNRPKEITLRTIEYY
jgi:hypothetical protein